MRLDKWDKIFLSLWAAVAVCVLIYQFMKIYFVL